MRTTSILIAFLFSLLTMAAKETLTPIMPEYVSFTEAPGAVAIATPDGCLDIVTDADDWAGVQRAARNLASDIASVTGQQPSALTSAKLPKQSAIIVGTIGHSRLIDKLIETGKLNVDSVKGQWESYVVQPIDGSIVIAGADKRGTIYGVYDLSQRIGVSPWHFWADVPSESHAAVYVLPGSHRMPSPKVKYRGLFLNDEAPCLTSWVENTYGTKYGGHEFYEQVFDLILRLKGNYLWPAMWGWSFYADDPANSPLADEMGVIMGTSHHEPMARNHQEWARHRSEYGEWDYNTNQAVIDQFFTEGIERSATNEDIITIGMRGDGDTAMGGREGHDDEYQAQDQAIIATLEKVISNQRDIISNVTGKPANERQQLWALYKEVQKYYDMGLRVPDDVIILLSDDNWGDVRRLPNAEERQHPGGWGMYYHVDYVGAPRNSKWLNITPVQNMWEQLGLAYEYGVDRLWILNVGDLKPMEYPITLFMEMAWDPDRFNASNIGLHPAEFCAEVFGPEYAEEAGRILNLYSKYNGRVTPEMLDATTYDLASGEWKQVRDDYLTLETDALRLYMQLPEELRPAYFQLILFPVQAMANLYDLYYSTAMNHHLYEQGDPACNTWADRADAAFRRDAALMSQYNNELLDGKWRGMMTQKHIGYRTWNDDFPADTQPPTCRIDDEASLGGYTFEADNGMVVIEGEHCYEAIDAPSGASWKVIPDMGRTLSGVTLMPRLKSAEGAALNYRTMLPEGIDSVEVHVVVKSTLPFADPEGHCYSVQLDGADPVTINFNANLNDQRGNPYEVFYPTVARRIVESTAKLPVKPTADGTPHILTIRPQHPGTVFEKIIIDCGGYTPSYLYHPESPKSK